MSLNDVHYWSLARVSAEIRLRNISPVEVASHLPDRVETLDPALNAFVHVSRESAIAAARQAEDELARGFYRGPLHGVPVAVKDLLFTHDAPTTGGTAFMAKTSPLCDAEAVARLRRAGAVMFGKLKTTEGASSHYAKGVIPPSNPWNPDYWCGASSSGPAAATAAGLCFATIGTDSGGSIRVPSAICGVIGLKPTWGRVSRYGQISMTESFGHTGPIARSCQDAALVLQVIAGRDLKDRTSLPESVPDYAGLLDGGIAGVRIGVDWSMIGDSAAPEIARAIRESAALLEEMGATVVEIALPDPLELLGYSFQLMMSEMLVAHAASYPSMADEYGDPLRLDLDRARKIPAADLTRGGLSRLRYRAELHAIFANVDVVLTPTLCNPTMSLAEMADADLTRMLHSVARFTFPFNATGNPAISLPAGFSTNGMPLGIQLAGRPLDEGLLLKVGHAFQTATDWHCRRPGV